MANKIVLKKSSVAAKVPVAGDLDFGELAINYTDGKLYFKKADNTIDAFTTAAASAPVTSVGGNIGDITDAQLLASIKNVDGTGSGLDADTLDGNHASAFYLASNPNGYTSNTGTVTSVGATAPLVSSGGTAPSISIPAANSTTNGYMSSAYASKLDGIAAGATANTGTVTSVSGTGGYGGLTLSGTITSSGSLTLGGTPTGTWPISITGSAATATSADHVAWNNISGRPGWLSGGSYIESHNNANDWRNSGFYENGGGGSNWPSQTWYNSINVRHSNQGNYHGFQIAMSYYDNNLWFRSYQGNGTFQSWTSALSTQNYTNYAVRQDYNTSLNSDTRNTRGVTRLYRRDDNSDYSVQTYWTGSHWYLQGFSGDTFHAHCRVGYADSAGNGGVTSVNGQTGAVNISALTDAGASFGGSSGYQRLSNGWIIQWGLYDRGGWTGNMYDSGENISFPITFPNACRSITTSPYTGGNNNTNWSSEPKVYSYTNSSWKRTGDGHRWIFWIAIGY